MMVTRGADSGLWLHRILLRGKARHTKQSIRN